jgi:uncharacterized MAPEG superfamily protein
VNALPIELQLVGWSVAVLLFHIIVQAQTLTREKGTPWNAGPRDGDNNAPQGRISGRALRALNNYKESFPAFVGLALALSIAGRTGGIGETGAWVWIGARIVYYPLYLFGIPYLRSLAWLVSIAGLIMMLVRFL